MDTIHMYCTELCSKTHNSGSCTANITSQTCVCLRMEVIASLPAHLSAWTHPLDTWWGYDLHCAAPFKNLSPYCRAQYKSAVVDWDIPSWLWAQGLGPVMNAAIICWCMKREVHHHLLHIKPWQSFSVLVTAPLALVVGGQGLCHWRWGCAVVLTGFYHLHASRNRLMCGCTKHVKRVCGCENSLSHIAFNNYVNIQRKKATLSILFLSAFDGHCITRNVVVTL